MNAKVVFVVVFVILLLAGSAVLMIPSFGGYNPKKWPVPLSGTPDRVLKKLNSTLKLNTVPVSTTIEKVPLPTGSEALGFMAEYDNKTQIIGIVAKLNISAKNLAQQVIGLYDEHKDKFSSFRYSLGTNNGFAEATAENLVFNLWYKGDWLIEVLCYGEDPGEAMSYFKQSLYRVING